MKRLSTQKFIAIASLIAVLIAYGLFSVSSSEYFTSTQPPSATTSPSLSATSSVPQLQYIEITDGCGPYFQGTCVNVRNGPGVEFPSVAKLRTGVVLAVSDTVLGSDGQNWYKIQFVHELLYPERVNGDWYVAAAFATLFTDDGDHNLKKGQHASTTKHILVDRSEEMLYAYDGDVLFMQEPISTGLEFTPTPRGTFTIFKMTPSRFMQGPIPGVSDQVYDLPGVPWNLYFTDGGAVIHGAYWHDHFGKPWSHGCVNLPPQKAKELYHWAEVGIEVTVKE